MAINSPSFQDEGPSSGGFAGQVTTANIADLIQFSCSNGSTLAFRVKTRIGQGYLCFEQGELHHAEFGLLRGEDAVFQMLSQDAGTFESCAHPRPGARSIDCSWQAVLPKAAQRSERVGNTSAPLLPGSTGEGRVNPRIGSLDSAKLGWQSIESGGSSSDGCCLRCGSGIRLLVAANGRSSAVLRACSGYVGLRFGAARHPRQARRKARFGRGPQGRAGQLAAAEYRVLRVAADEVERALPQVVQRIRAAL